MEKLMKGVLCILMLAGCQTKENTAKENKSAKNKAIEKLGMHGEQMTHQQITQVFSKPKADIRTVGILLYDGYAALDAMGPYAVFGELMGTKVFFVGIHSGTITDGRGMKVQVDASIEQINHLDVLVIPGGLNQTYALTKDQKLLNWIRRIDSTSKYTASVCTGAWILGAAGLLKDKQATTHWYGKKMLADEFGARIQNTRYAHTGKYWTSAGVTAGMDMSLAILNEIAGENYTKAAMLDLEYDPQPPFEGGSESNTDKDLVEAIRAMYDGGMAAVLHPEQKLTAVRFDNEKDFVCSMLVSAGVADTAHYKGKIYGFCSPLCKNEFKKNPVVYLNQ